MYHHRAFLPDEILRYLVQFLSWLNFSIKVIWVSCHYVELKLHVCQQCVWVRCPVTAAQCVSLYWNDSDALGVQPPGSKLGSLWNLGVTLWRALADEKQRCKPAASNAGDRLTCWLWTDWGVWVTLVQLNMTTGDEKKSSQQVQQVVHPFNVAS